MSRQQYQPALSVLLQQQAQQQQQQQQPFEGTRLSRHESVPAIQSPYRSKQAVKGLGRQQPQAMQRKSAKGLLRAASAANLKPAQLAPLQGRLAPLDQGQGQPQQQKPFPAFVPQQQQQQAPQSQQQQLRGSASSGALVGAQPGESWESQHFRSLPPHSYAGSHYWEPASSAPRVVIHSHAYPDGSVVDECACERGAKLVQAQRATGQAQQQQQAEEKEQTQTQQQTPQKAAASAAAAASSVPPVLSPSQIARAHITYARQQRPVDTSRQHSLYASTFTQQPIQAFTKLGRGYFASHNKSYIRSCLMDPGYGFQLEQLRAQQQNDPNMLNFAAEITREHQEPQLRLTSIISPVNQPDTTHHKDYAAPPADLVKAYKRVGKDYRQAGNKSYIRYNLVDPSAGAQPEQPQLLPNHQINVPFTANTTHQTSFVDHTSHYPEIRARKAYKIKFGGESNAEQNPWQRWDDNME